MLQEIQVRGGVKKQPHPSGGGVDFFLEQPNKVLWVERPPFVDSCGIFWTKFCDSRLTSMIHSS